MAIPSKLKLSYIIPVYNGERTVGGCLDSIFSTGIPEDEFEVIVIDDCSTDASISTVESYISSHPNISLIRQSRNHRQGAARNRGLDIAAGRYVTFVDCDDLVEEGMASALEEALLNDADICVPRSQTNFYTNGGFRPIKPCVKLDCGKLCTGLEYCRAVINFVGIEGTPWGYLFKNSYVQKTGVRFVEDHLFEETDWVAYHFLHAGSVFLSDKLAYSYIKNPSSIMAGRMSIAYVVDSTLLVCRMMRLADSFRKDDPELSALWAEGADSGLLSKSLRAGYLIKYPIKELRSLHSRIGEECLTYMRDNYRIRFFAKMFFRHRNITVEALILLRIMKIFKRWIFGQGADVPNIYNR